MIELMVHALLHNQMIHAYSFILQALSQSWYFFLRALFKCISAVVVNAVVTPVFLAVIFPVVVGYIILQKFFLATSRYGILFCQKVAFKNCSFAQQVHSLRKIFGPCSNCWFYMITSKNGELRADIIVLPCLSHLKVSHLNVYHIQGASKTREHHQITCLCQVFWNLSWTINNTCLQVCHSHHVP